MTGQRFGKLVVIERAENQGYKPMWLCQCDCGNQKIVRADRLKEGSVTSCGCVSNRKYRSSAKDLTGMKFNRLTVIKRMPNRNDKAMWLCKCECGNEKIVESYHLTSGKIKSCGCYKKEVTSKRSLKDLTGMKFGRWTVLHRAPNKNKRTAWTCKCECGTIKDISSNDLLCGDSKSCGCYKIDNHYYKDLTGQKYGLLTVIEKVESHRFKGGGITTRWKCKCECGKEVVVMTGNLRSGITKSCGCLYGSYGERIVSDFLKNHNIEYVKQYTFKDCRDVNPLPFDFYLPKYNICIEYDGEQHYMPKSFFGGEEGFKKRTAHDRMKDEYCEKNNIKLLRLPYYLSNKQVEQEIINVLNP